MPPLTPAVRIGASSILLLSVTHILFWAWLSFAFHASPVPYEYPYNLVVPVLTVVTCVGLIGIFIAVGVFRARNWARIAAIAMATLVALFCLLAFLGLAVVNSGLLSAGLGIEIPPKSDLIRVGLVYLLIFGLAVWWIFLFSRKTVAAQFSAKGISATSAIPQKPACPPPIALLAWLMIASSALSAISWPLILGKIPAMLFTHIFAAEPSKWIWIANILLFALCGIGLLKLQKWSYNATIALHAFWLVSLFVSQLSPLYEKYLGICFTALQAEETIVFIHFKFPPWIAAVTTAIPTLILIIGLFYYRPAFLKAVVDSRHLSA